MAAQVPVVPKVPLAPVEPALLVPADPDDPDDPDSPLRFVPLPALKSPADELPPPLCARRAGFSLYAARTVDKDDRHGPGRLCSKFVPRPFFAADRLSILQDGRVR